jgi:hypothetical protein
VGSLFSHFFEFILAVASAWKTLVAGVIFFAASLPNNLLSSNHREKLDRFAAPETRRKALLWIAGLCLFFACFQAWDSEHQDRRSLNDEQRREFGTELAKLKTLTPHLVLSLTNGDLQSEAYTLDFADAVRRVGLKTISATAIPDNQDQTGVIIAVKDPTSPPAETEPLRAALKSIGIEPKILGFPLSGFSVSGVDNATFHPDIVLWIAPRPL